MCVCVCVCVHVYVCMCVRVYVCVCVLGGRGGEVSSFFSLHFLLFFSLIKDHSITYKIT